MTKAKTRVSVVALLSVLVSPVVWAGWIHQENAVYVGKKSKKQKHPSFLQQTIVMPLDSEAPLVCIVYANSKSIQTSDTARISSLITIEDSEGEQNILSLSVKIRKHGAMKCKDAPDLQAGDMVTFEHLFEGFRRLRSSEDSRQGFGMTGLVSTSGKPSIGAGPLALESASGTTPLGLVHTGESGWFHSANSVFHTDKKDEEHPAGIIRAIVMPVDSNDQPLVCSGYSRISDEKGEGKVKTTASIERTDGTVEVLNFNGRVRKDQYLKCKEASKAILQGEVVSFESEYAEMPLLAKSVFADLVGAVTSTGEPAFRTTGGGGATPPDTPTSPAPGNILSTADEHAVTRLFQAGLSKNKLVRPRAMNPTKWLIVGPGTKLGSNGGRIPNTIGLGGTIAAALADYERKQGKIGGQARLLNGADRAAMEWFSRMDSKNGPTNIRGFTNGSIGAEVFRPNIGSRVSGPVGSIAAAVNFLKKLGL